MSLQRLEIDTQHAKWMLLLWMNALSGLLIKLFLLLRCQGCDAPFVFSECGAPCEKQCALRGRTELCVGGSECTPGCYCPQVCSSSKRLSPFPYISLRFIFSPKACSIEAYKKKGFSPTWRMSISWSLTSWSCDRWIPSPTTRLDDKIRNMITADCAHQ